MEATVTSFRERLKRPWLEVSAQVKVAHWFERRLKELTEAQSHDAAATVLLAEKDPLALLGGFLAAVAAHAPVFMGSPDWREYEWTQVAAQLEPDLIWGHAQFAPHVTLDLPDVTGFRGHIMIPTGGTGGRVRFAAHTWKTLTAAVEGYGAFFQAKAVHAWCVLPLWHVSGLMQAIRTFYSGGRLILGDYRVPEEPPADMPERAAFHLSLVPTQLGRILDLEGGEAWLRGFGLILLGGAATPTPLQARARQAELRISSGYGMTETAAVVVAQRPEDSINSGATGEVLPHASVEIVDGEIVIHAQSLYCGYFPQNPHQREEFRPGDDGKLDKQGRLQVIGRRDRLIISGGEKIDPLEVEGAIRRLAPLAEVLVVGEPDPDWGQRVVAILAEVSEEELHPLKSEIKDLLQPAFAPKRWILTSALPIKPNGKLDHVALAQLLAPGV